MRRYEFPSLDRRLAVSGKAIAEHKDLLTADLTAARDAYVDTINLSSTLRGGYMVIRNSLSRSEYHLTVSSKPITEHKNPVPLI
jgi:hypothetical protein